MQLGRNNPRVWAVLGAVALGLGAAGACGQPAPERLTLPAIDVDRELARSPDRPGAPLRFAVGKHAKVTPETHGRWKQRSDRHRSWRLEITVPGATDLNLAFDRFLLPAGASLTIGGGPEGREIAHRFGPEHNRDKRRLWAPILPGAVARLELVVPPEASFEPQLRISKVSGGFRDAWQLAGGPGLKSHGDCNIDVACPEGDAWRDQASSVALYSIEGEFACSGTLIADASHSRRPFFLTAYHCGVTASNADSVVTYWNYQAPTCNGKGAASLDKFVTGAVWRAARRDVDMLLLELDASPSKLFSAFHSGWDRSDMQPAGSVAIHHPRSEPKSISINQDAPTDASNCIVFDDTGPTHWIVDDWESGTTEPGSSGSGLWDIDSGKLIGFLSGGTASCSNPTGFDCYGKFAEAWEGPTSQSRLRDWLDPAEEGPKSMPGVRPDFMFRAGFESEN